MLQITYVISKVVSLINIFFKRGHYRNNRRIVSELHLYVGSSDFCKPFNIITIISAIYKICNCQGNHYILISVYKFTKRN